MRRACPVMLVLLCAALAGPARGDEDEGEDEDGAESGQASQPIEELFLGELAFVQAPLELQLTWRPEWRRSGHEDLLLSAFSAELGLTQRIQLELTVPLLWCDEVGSTTVGRPEVGLLASVYHGERFALAVGVELHLPAVSDELEDEQDYAGETFATAHWALGPVHLDLGLSLELEQEDDWVELSPGATAGATLVWLDPLFFTLELALELEDDELDATVAAGVIWHPVDDVELGLAVPVGITGEHEVGVLLSLTVELGG